MRQYLQGAAYLAGKSLKSPQSRDHGGASQELLDWVSSAFKHSFGGEATCWPLCKCLCSWCEENPRIRS
jgi:hypothetical protein